MDNVYGPNSSSIKIGQAEALATLSFDDTWAEIDRSSCFAVTINNVFNTLKTMSAKAIVALLLLLTVPVASADSSDDENSQLRAEIAALKARNETLEKACPSTAGATAPTVSAQPSSSPVSGRTVTEAPAAGPMSAGAGAPAAEPAKLYADTGCDQGILSGPPPGKWRSGKAWRKVNNGMSMGEVESIVGVEHYDEQKKNSVEWQYGRCGRGWEGSVDFVNGEVVAVSPPGQ